MKDWKEQLKQIRNTGAINRSNTSTSLLENIEAKPIVDIKKQNKNEERKLRRLRQQEANRLVKEKFLVDEAKLLVKRYKLSSCDICNDGEVLLPCPLCNGSKRVQPRPVTTSIAVVCRNTSPSCPNCFGTGVYTIDKETLSDLCECRTGIASNKCPNCNGTGVAVLVKTKQTLSPMQLLRMLKQKGKKELLLKVKKLIQKKHTINN